MPKKWWDTFITWPASDSDIDKLLAEQRRREREKWLAKVRQCLAEMPVSGNGRRLLMMLISEMEKGE